MVGELSSLFRKYHEIDRWHRSFLATVVILSFGCGGGTLTSPTGIENSISPGHSPTVDLIVNSDLSGYVKNTSGAGSAGVTVTLSGAASTTTQTESSGYYSFAELSAGR